MTEPVILRPWRGDVADRIALFGSSRRAGVAAQAQAHAQGDGERALGELEASKERGEGQDDGGLVGEFRRGAATGAPAKK